MTVSPTATWRAEPPQGAGAQAVLAALGGGAAARRVGATARSHVEARLAVEARLHRPCACSAWTRTAAAPRARSWSSAPAVLTCRAHARRLLCVCGQQTDLGIQHRRHRNDSACCWHGLSSNKMALITSDCGAADWPAFGAALCCGAAALAQIECVVPGAAEDGRCRQHQRGADKEMTAKPPAQPPRPSYFLPEEFEERSKEQTGPDNALVKHMFGAAQSVMAVPVTQRGWVGGWVGWMGGGAMAPHSPMMDPRPAIAALSSPLPALVT